LVHRFIHIGLTFGETLKAVELEPAIQAIADDWIRYAPNNWIIWTTATNQEVSAALRRNLTLNDQFLLFPINPTDRDGWHHQWVWDWLSKPRFPNLSPSPLATAIDWTALAGLAALTPPKKL
jgi:hypothetical protein